MYLYLSLALTVCAGIGFAYGLYRFFRDESALYVRMIVFAVGCAMLGRLFETLLILVNGGLTNGFHVGMLGIIGCFMFLFSANFGQMDSIVDDGSKRFFKTRLISFAAPLVIAAIWVFIAVTKGLNEKAIPLGVVFGAGGGVLFIPSHLAEEVVDGAAKTHVKDDFGFEMITAGRFTTAQIDRATWTVEMLDMLMEFIRSDPRGEPYRELDWSHEYDLARNGDPNDTRSAL